MTNVITKTYTYHDDTWVEGILRGLFPPGAYKFLVANSPAGPILGVFPLAVGQLYALREIVRARHIAGADAVLGGGTVLRKTAPLRGRANWGSSGLVGAYGRDRPDPPLDSMLLENVVDILAQHGAI